MLQATALVREASLRLVDADHARHWNSRAHFFGAAAEAMRRILVDHARRKRSLKRGGEFNRVEPDAIEATGVLSVEDVPTISEALEKLTQHDSEKAELVKLRYFGGFRFRTQPTYWAYPARLPIGIGNTPRLGCIVN